MPDSPSPPLPPPPLSRDVKRAIWGLGVTQIIGWGTTYYLLALLGVRIVEDLNMPKAVMLGGVSLTLIGAAFLGPFVGRWQDRRGSREVMVTGSAVLALGLAVIAMSQGVITYYLGWLIVAIGTPMTLYGAAFTALTQMAGKNARRAIIFLTFMGGLASTVSWPATALLLNVLEWRQIVLLFAGLNLFLCLPIHALVLGGAEQVSGNGAASNPVPPGLPPEAIAKAFLLLAAMLAVNSLVFNGWSMLVFPVMTGLGYVEASAVLFASLVGVFQVIGRMGEMASGERFTAFQTATFAIALLPLSFVVLMAGGGSAATGFIFALLYGIANGLVTIARGALTLSIFGSAGYGERFGKVTVASGLMGAAAPVVGGIALELSGAMGLLTGFLLLACVSLAFMLALKLHCRRHGLV
jgi:predicted MFS family arabinose efflux permease